MATSPVHLRLAAPGDAAALAVLKLRTFRETFLEDFAIPYPADDLAQFERDTYGEPKVAAELNDPAHRSWVAEDADGKLLGYVHVGPCKLPHPDVAPSDYELQQIYLRRDAQGRGIGARLLQQSLAWLDAQGGSIWIGVWSGNARAQAIYAAQGFAHVGDYHFRVGQWLDDEFIYMRPARG